MLAKYGRLLDTARTGRGREGPHPRGRYLAREALPRSPPRTVTPRMMPVRTGIHGGFRRVMMVRRLFVHPWHTGHPVGLARLAKDEALEFLTSHRPSPPPRRIPLSKLSVLGRAPRRVPPRPAQCAAPTGTRWRTSSHLTRPFQKSFAVGYGTYLLLSTHSGSGPDAWTPICNPLTLGKEIRERGTEPKEDKKEY